LNYTPEKEDGSIDPKKAISIAESFEVSETILVLPCARKQNYCT
jgi:hypothetical protein